MMMTMSNVVVFMAPRFLIVDGMHLSASPIWKADFRALRCPQRGPGDT